MSQETLRFLSSVSSTLSALLSAAIAFVLNQYQSLRESPKLAGPFKRFAKYLIAGLVLSAASALVSLSGLLLADLLTSYLFLTIYLSAGLFAMALLVVVVTISTVYREVTA